MNAVDDPRPDVTPGPTRGPWVRGEIQVVGHRGARGDRPENTLSAVRSAIASGATGIEIDVRMTLDGHLVLWHDPILLASKCTFTGHDFTGARISELTLHQLRTVDIGSKTLPGAPHQKAAPGETFVALSQVIAACDDSDLRPWWTIEVKSDPTDPASRARRDLLVDAVLAELDEAPIRDRCFVHSFDWSVLERAERLVPDLTRSALVEDGITWEPGSPWLGSRGWDRFSGDLVAAVADLGARVVSPSASLVDATLVDAAHREGLAVLPWTVDDPDELVRLGDLGVDGIVCDRPGAARVTLERAGFTVGSLPPERR